MADVGLHSWIKKLVSDTFFKTLTSIDPETARHPRFCCRLTDDGSETASICFVEEHLVERVGSCDVRPVGLCIGKPV